MQDREGQVYVDGTDVVYGTSLEVIRPVPAGPLYRLRELKGMMKGIDQLAGIGAGSFPHSEGNGYGTFPGFIRTCVPN